MVSEEELRSLVGTKFPGGTYTIEPYVNWLTCDCVLAPELAGMEVAHPVMVYVATQSGMGLTLAELFALCKASSADGPMLGEWGMQVYAPVRTETPYTVTGAITGVQRKTGKRTGVFDIVEFELQLHDPGDGTLVAVTRSSFIFPRRG